ncbi:Protein NIF3 [Pleurostoma richardsiae]|uniref:Protein NIF3 n=1 Tax=Pleurostoma richardsiae TaxID=41990 RepID=A0AA38RV82_9PEZI|nr:Protein NIF3 [Pleurostoma richardsiae]
METPTTQASSFTKAVVKAMNTLYPETLADTAWDNVGLLLGNTERSGQVQNTVLLTNDLTPEVADEAIKEKASVIVSYHPFIFRGLKSITLDDPQQRTLLHLAQNNVAVYCPHTAVDAAPGGLNDWLADMLEFDGIEASRSVAQPVSRPAPAGFEGSGYGRVLSYRAPVKVSQIAKKLATGLGGIRHVMMALPRRASLETLEARSAAVCAGSGFDILSGCNADVIVTGEMTHHHALKATMEGRVVITVFHSNSEREFLAERMEPALLKLLQSELGDVRVVVSKEDADPFFIMDVRDL